VLHFSIRHAGVCCLLPAAVSSIFSPLPRTQSSNDSSLYFLNKGYLMQLSGSGAYCKREVARKPVQAQCQPSYVHVLHIPIPLAATSSRLAGMLCEVVCYRRCGERQWSVAPMPSSCCSQAAAQGSCLVRVAFSLPTYPFGLQWAQWPVPSSECWIIRRWS
jgi:hypothetical protein